MLIPEMNDRFDLKIKDVTFKLKPMSYSQKMEIDGCYKQEGGMVVPEVDKQLFLLLKYMIDDVSGIKCFSGEDYVIEKKDGFLSPKSINELMNIEVQQEMLSALYSCKSALPSENLFNFATMEPLEGVKIVYSGKEQEVPEGKKQ